MKTKNKKVIISLICMMIIASFPLTVGAMKMPSPPTLKGPTDGEVGMSYTFVTNSEGEYEEVYYRFCFDDDVTDWYGPFTDDDNDVFSYSYKWFVDGVHIVKSQAKWNLDTNEFSESLPLEITITGETITISKPVGTEIGITGESYTYSSTISDCKEVYYRFCYELGDDPIWIDVNGENGYDVVSTHTWYTPGQYNVIVQACFQINGQISFVSESLLVNIIESSGVPPTPGKLTGSQSVLINKNHLYSSQIHGEEDIYYQFNMGNGYTTRWMGPSSPGVKGYIYSWDTSGTYEVTVLASYYSDGYIYSESPSLTVRVYDGFLIPNAPLIPQGDILINENENHIYVTMGDEIKSEESNNNLYYQFNWDDGTTSDWMGPYKPNIFVGCIHSWQTDGVYNITARASIYPDGIVYSESLPLTVQVLPDLIPNIHPETPDILIGPVDGEVGQSLSFTANSTDPDGDDIKYGWDWNGDDTVDEWTDYLSSGEICIISHIWNVEGTYDVQVKAKDDRGASSDFSDVFTIVITDGTPPPPPPEGISIKDIKGGIGITASLVNNEGEDISDVNWTITVKRGLLNRVIKESNDEVDIDGNDEVEIKTGLFFGIGRISITIEASYGDAEPVKKTVDGMILLIFVKI